MVDTKKIQNEFYYEECEQDEPDSKMMDYHPYSKGKNPKHTPGSRSQGKSHHNLPRSPVFQYIKLHCFVFSYLGCKFCRIGTKEVNIDSLSGTSWTLWFIVVVFIINPQRACARGLQ